MKNPITLLVLTSCASLAFTSPALSEEEDPTLTDRAASYIIGRASSLLLGSVESSLLNAIFGSSSSDAVVRLHQDSLDQIESLILAQSDRDRVLQIRGDLNTLIDLIDNANATFEHSGYQSSVMYGLIDRGYALINHQGYVANEEFFKLTRSKALAYSLLASLEAIRSQQGEISSGRVQSLARGWAVDLARMGSAADSYIYNNVTISFPHSMCGGQEPYDAPPQNQFSGRAEVSSAISCNYQVFDNISNQTFQYDPLRDPTFASQRAYSKLNELRDRYRDVFKGSDFTDVIAELEDF